MFQPSFSSLIATSRIVHQVSSVINWRLWRISANLEQRIRRSLALQNASKAPEFRCFGIDFDPVPTQFQFESLNWQSTNPGNHACADGAFGDLLVIKLAMQLVSAYSFTILGRYRRLVKMHHATVKSGVVVHLLRNDLSALNCSASRRRCSRSWHISGSGHMITTIHKYTTRRRFPQYLIRKNYTSVNATCDEATTCSDNFFSARKFPAQQLGRIAFSLPIGQLGRSVNPTQVKL